MLSSVIVADEVTVSGRDFCHGKSSPFNLWERFILNGHLLWPGFIPAACPVLPHPASPLCNEICCTGIWDKATSVKGQPNPHLFTDTASDVCTLFRRALGIEAKCSCFRKTNMKMLLKQNSHLLPSRLNAVATKEQSGGKTGRPGL